MSGSVRARGHFLGGRWVEGVGAPLLSEDPATGEILWQGRAAVSAEVDRAVRAARAAFPGWADRSLEARAAVLEAFRAGLEKHRAELARTISRETGKPLWESSAEVGTMIGKVALTMEAYRARSSPSSVEKGGERVATRYRPHGVLAVLGPFNMPGHLPNGHIVPALLAGDTVVLKPSELAPLVAERTVVIWEEAGLPDGVLNLVQGGRDTGQALATHPDLDGLLFTGSFEAGRALGRIFAEQPGKILALELGGNNPLVVWDVSEPALDGAALLAVQSAFVTAGQRCTCARRLIVPRGEQGDHILGRLMQWTERVHVGAFTEHPEPFAGPVISIGAGERVLAAQAELVAHGAHVLVEAMALGARVNLLTPGIIDVTDVKDRADREIFGPLLQVFRARTFDDALVEANHTRFGLAAGLVSDDPELWSEFRSRIRAGVVNWNRPTTGASGALPFGGVGQSGNHRPSGFFAVDYCSYPVATLERSAVSVPDTPLPGIARP
jgi:succinylglutamic semialdehyde dehydrogenase